MKKHGPDLTNKPRHLVPCPACNGHGQRRGVFYDIDCDACGAAGFVDGAGAGAAGCGGATADVGKAAAGRAATSGEQAGARRE